MQATSEPAYACVRVHRYTHTHMHTYMHTQATSEPYADNSIGNITGSNSVNVFLGLGLPWAMAAVYWTYLASPAATQAWHHRYHNEAW